jgi:hypothetical protein
MKNIEQKISDYNDIIRKHIEKSDFVKLDRKFKDIESRLNGIILQLSDNFLLVEIIDDFLINGFAIIRIDQFESYSCGKYEKSYKKILLSDSIISETHDEQPSIDLTNWQSIFNSLRKIDFHVIIECEDLDEPTFTIGPIKRITEKCVSVQNYDPTGKLDDINTIIEFDDITLLQFGDRYSTTFRKYLKTAKKNKK